jgi:hypothetical protein
MTQERGNEKYIKHVDLGSQGKSCGRRRYRSEAAKISFISMLVLRVLTPCVLVYRCRSFGEINCLHLQGFIFLHSFIYLQVHRALEPIRPQKTNTDIFTAIRP